MADGPTIQISRELKPDIADFSFDINRYTNGLHATGAPEDVIDSLVVRFSNKDNTKTFRADLTATFFGAYLANWGDYDAIENRITLYPRTMDFGPEHEYEDGPPKGLAAWIKEAGGDFTGLLNYVLAHETGHLAYVAHETVPLFIRTHARAAHTRSRVGRRAIAYGGLGAICGSEIGLISPLPPAIGTLAGMTIGAAVGLFKHDPELSEAIIRKKALLEVEHEWVDEFLAEPQTQSLFGDIVQMEFKK